MQECPSQGSCNKESIDCSVVSRIFIPLATTPRTSEHSFDAGEQGPCGLSFFTPFFRCIVQEFI